MINHRTTKPKNKTEHKIEKGSCQRVQENILKYLESKGRACGKKELLPCSIYREEKLKTAVDELIEKGAIDELNLDGKDMYKTS
jgi:hypothetical protein